MALDIYLRIDGITGGMRGVTFKGWSEVLSWRWALARDMPSAGTAGTETVRGGRIVVRKKTGADSPALLAMFSERRQSATAEIRAIPVVSKREAAQKYVSIVLEDVRIDAIDMGGATGDDYFAEEIVLGFRGVTFEHSSYGPSGPDAAPEAATDVAFRWQVPDGDTR